MHVAITGASSGIGAALARYWGGRGAQLSLVARRRERMEEIAAEYEGRSAIHACDLSQLDRACSWVDDAESQLGPIDVLINNAGVQVIAPTAEVDVASGERSIAINLLAPLRLCRYLLPRMLERKGGALVNVASMAALAPVAGMTYYNATKGGLAAASESLHGELRDSGVHVVTVYPGVIPTTEMGDRALGVYAPSRALALQPRGDVDTLARQIGNAIDRRAARVIYPRVNGLARWFPALTRALLDRFTPELTGRTDGGS